MGDFHQVQAIFKNHGKSIPLFGADGKISQPAHEATAPEFVAIQGILESGALASITLQCTPATAVEPTYRWVVTGSEGELQFTHDSRGFIQGDPSLSKLFLKKWKDDLESVDVSRDEPEHVSSMPLHAINTARLYEALATGDAEGVPTLEAARKVHHFIERVKEVAVWAP